MRQLVLQALLRAVVDDRESLLQEFGRETPLEEKRRIEFKKERILGGAGAKRAPEGSTVRATPTVTRK